MRLALSPGSLQARPVTQASRGSSDRIIATTGHPAHFADEETEAQRGPVNSPRPQVSKGQALSPDSHGSMSALGKNSLPPAQPQAGPVFVETEAPGGPTIWWNEQQGVLALGGKLGVLGCGEN